MSDDPVDTGFDAVIAGDVYKPPEPEPEPEIVVLTQPGTHGRDLTVTVKDAPPQQPHECVNAAGGTRCDICFGPIEPTLPPPAPSPTVDDGLTPAGVEAAKALVQLPKHLDWPTLAQLAREVAMNIKERSTILNDFNITQVQYDFLSEHNEFYRAALAQACKEWHAPLTTQERIKVEAAAILEDSLLVLGARMQNKGEGLPGVVEAAKLFAKIADVGERGQGQAAPGERFTINIDLGGDKSLTIDTKAAPAPSPLRILPGDLAED